MHDSIVFQDIKLSFFPKKVSMVLVKSTVLTIAKEIERLVAKQSPIRN